MLKSARSRLADSPWRIVVVIFSSWIWYCGKVMPAALIVLLPLNWPVLSILSVCKIFPGRISISSAGASSRLTSNVKLSGCSVIWFSNDRPWDPHANRMSDLGRCNFKGPLTRNALNGASFATVICPGLRSDSCPPCSLKLTRIGKVTLVLRASSCSRWNRFASAARFSSPDHVSADPCKLPLKVNLSIVLPAYMNPEEITLTSSSLNAVTWFCRLMVTSACALMSARALSTINSRSVARSIWIPSAIMPIVTFALFSPLLLMRSFVSCFSSVSSVEGIPRRSTQSGSRPEASMLLSSASVNFPRPSANSVLISTSPLRSATFCAKSSPSSLRMPWPCSVLCCNQLRQLSPAARNSGVFPSALTVKLADPLSGWDSPDKHQITLSALTSAVTSATMPDWCR